jgi:hypothetical protein
MVHDIEDQFRLVWLKEDEGLKPSKKDFTSHLKSYVKKLLKKLEENNAPAEEIALFKANAAGALKKISGNYDNYDVMMGESMDGDAMYVSNLAPPPPPLILLLIISSQARPD